MPEKTTCSPSRPSQHISTGGNSLDSLEQLQRNDDAPEKPVESDLDAAMVGLPPSEAGTLRDGGSAHESGYAGALTSMDTSATQHVDIASCVPPQDSALPRPRRDAACETLHSDSLDQLESKGLPSELEQALPSFTEVSVGGASSSVRSRNATVDSLEQLRQFESVHASAISLPQSSDAQSGAARDSTSEAMPEPTKQDYWQTIEPLVRCLPHLNILGPSSGRHKRVGKVTSIDYHAQGGPVRVNEPMEISMCNNRTIKSKIAALRDVASPEILSRLIVVEDLCPELIEALGSTFQLDPEFFAEHLCQSGYNCADYNDAPPARWNTAHLPKDYVTLTWFRPVYLQRWSAERYQAPAALLDKQMVLKKGVSRTLMSSVTWRDAAFEVTGERDTEAKEHIAVANTNIFRQGKPISARATPSSDISYRGPIAGRSEWVPTALMERASFCCTEATTGEPIGILLLDPLPTITDWQVPLHKRKHRRDGSASGRLRYRGEAVPIDPPLPIAPRYTVAIPPNKYHATVPETNLLKRSLKDLPSTFSAIVFCAPGAAERTTDGLRADAILRLLRLIQSDMQTCFRCLECCLDDVRRDSIDDFIMTRQLSHWRKLLSDFEIEVPAVGKNLERFANFVFRSSPIDTLPGEVIEILEAINHGIARTKVKLDEAYAGLRVDMQFTESRRGFTETQMVTRLTELAFVFIPLSFCASLFSMSIRELQNGVPAWTFAVTALTAMALAYAVRWFIGSEILVNSIRTSFERFWARAGISRGDNAPIATITWLTLQELWKAGRSQLVAFTAGGLCFAAFVVLPVAFMWGSTHMGSSLSVAVTLLLILSALIVPAAMFASGRLIQPSSRLYNQDDQDSDEEV